MKPNNLNNSNCESTSSNCIIWDGPKIDCIDLCPGDNITIVVYKLAIELCAIINELDISTYQLRCLSLNGGVDATFKDLIQGIIDKICNVNNITNSNTVTDLGTVLLNGGRTAGGQNCPDCIVSLPTCLQYNNPANGDLVTTGLLNDVVQRVAIRLCDLVAQVNLQTAINSDFSERITILENKNTPQYQLPRLFPVCIDNPTISLQLDEFVSKLEKAYCEFTTSTGSSSRVFNAIETSGNLNDSARLGTGGGNLSSMDGWISQVQSLADSVSNMWLVIKDVRSAVANIKQNCCNTLCDGIEFNMTVTLTSPATLNFFFTGNIPANLDNCVQGGTLFTISDKSGHSVKTTIDIKQYMNIITGFSLTVQGSPLNMSDDFDISATMCFTDSDTGSVCQQCIETTVINTIACSVLNLTSTANSINYSFITLQGTNTYSIQVFAPDNTVIASQTTTTNTSQVVNGILSGLGANTVYRVRVQIITINNTKTCPFTVITTQQSTCPAPNVVTAILTIP